jgi:hypothetical protein
MKGTLMQCTQCKEQIEDDSRFCDQCGTGLKLCPICGVPGKGKCCTKCGATLTSPGSAPHARQIDSSETLSPKPAEAVALAQSPAPVAMPAPTPAYSPNSAANAKGGTLRLAADHAVHTAKPTLRLLNSKLGIDLVIRDSSTLGRTLGDYVSIFARFGEVSSRHCDFRYDPALGWCVTDLGSTNKTCYNNLELAPSVSQPLTDRGFLKIANIEFYVRIEAS